MEGKKAKELMEAIGEFIVTILTEPLPKSPPDCVQRMMELDEEVGRMILTRMMMLSIMKDSKDCIITNIMLLAVIEYCKGSTTNKVSGKDIADQLKDEICN